MVIFISIVAFILSSDAPPTLAQNRSITSDQLFAYWESVKEDIKLSRNAILVKQDLEIINLVYGAQQVKVRISERFNEHNKAYRKAVGLTLEESDDEESIACIMKLNDELIRIYQQALEVIDDRITEAQSIIENFIYFLNTVLESVGRLRSSVNACNKSYCASEISALLFRTHEMVLQDIETFEEELSDSYTNTYLTLNDEIYDSYIYRHILKLKLCV